MLSPHSDTNIYILEFGWDYEGTIVVAPYSSIQEAKAGFKAFLEDASYDEIGYGSWEFNHRNIWMNKKMYGSSYDFATITRLKLNETPLPNRKH